MSLKTMTRRSFVQLAAVTGAAMGLSGAVAGTALAEGDGAAAAAAGAGEVKRVRSCCRACGKNECGVDVDVRHRGQERFAESGFDAGRRPPG